MKRIFTNSIGLIVVLFQSACYSDLLLTSQEEFKEYSGKKSFWVMQANKLNGDTIFYSRKTPGVLTDSAVIIKIKSEKSIPKSLVDSTKMNFNELRLTKFWKDGTIYRIHDTSDSLFFYYEMDTFAVPLPDIAEIKAIKFQKGASGVLMIGSISVAAAGLFYLVFALMFSGFSIF